MLLSFHVVQETIVALHIALKDELETNADATEMAQVDCGVISDIGLTIVILDSSMETVQVFIRFRSSEKGDLAPWSLSQTTVSLGDGAQSYAFDRIFPPETTQSDVFSVSSKPLLDSLYLLLSLDGYNATIFAYGQSVPTT